MSTLTVNAQIVRVYAEAVRKAFGPLLEQQDAGGEMLRLLLSLADATALCAENMAETQAQLNELARMLDIANEPARFSVIKGGKP